MADAKDRESPGLGPIEAVAVLRGPFKEKFGTPRQPGLVEIARSEVVLLPPFSQPQALDGLDGFSHVWLLWKAHLNRQREGFRASVRPPRLGGNRRVGVFASRSPYRPNGLGLSVVRLLRVDALGGVLEVAGADLVDGTPIVDIKPYLPYCDAIGDAKAGFASKAPEVRLEVVFSPGIVADPAARELVVECLQADPRPAFHDDPQRRYFLSLGSWQVGFRVVGDQALVESLDRVPE